MTCSSCSCSLSFLLATLWLYWGSELYEVMGLVRWSIIYYGTQPSAEWQMSGREMGPGRSALGYWPPPSHCTQIQQANAVYSEILGLVAGVCFCAHPPFSKQTLKHSFTFAVMSVNLSIKLIITAQFNKSYNLVKCHVKWGFKMHEIIFFLLGRVTLCEDESSFSLETSLYQEKRTQTHFHCEV